MPRSAARFTAVVGQQMMKMRWIQSVLPIVTCGFLTSCATHALWVATDPREYVVVSQSDVNEQEMKAKGIAYYTDPAHGVLYVEKTAMQKNKDYMIRALGTPVTVVLDTAATVVVVGAAVWVLGHGAPASPAYNAWWWERYRSDQEQKKLDSLGRNLDAAPRAERESPNKVPEPSVAPAPQVQH
jgi:hypothetical protein